MDITNSNKAAWEEAFDKRSLEWEKDRLHRLATESLPYLEKDLVFELEGLDLTGMDIAQFCCNDGRELLSLYHAGARSGVGFDIAENMVAFANGCARSLGFGCHFVATDILAIDDGYKEAFDLALITIGALSWFEDLPAFFRKVSFCLKPGGMLFLHEMHPVTGMLGAAGEPEFDEAIPERPIHSYFRKNPWIENTGIGYLTGRRYESKTFVSFSFTFEDLFGAIIGSGIQVEKLKESDHDISELFERLESKGIPLSFLIIGRKM